MASWTVVKDDGTEVIVEADNMFVHPEGTMLFKMNGHEVIENYSPSGYLSCRKNPVT